LDVKLSVDILREKWQKLVFNAAFNSVSTLTDSTFAEVAECEDSKDVAMSIVTEGIMIASREGVELPPDTSESAFHLATALGNARWSMLNDRLAGRSMEVDALVSVTLRRGNQYGICTPATETVLSMLDHTNVETISRRDGIVTDTFG
jgi:2-dehydropantoate 2-reductase